MKKIITAMLIVTMMSMTNLSLLAIETATDNTPKQFNTMVKKNKNATDEYKYAYVNMDFWSEFDDDILSGYIAKAVMNNYDLKTASLNVEEYYQNTKAQFSNELPKMTAGFAPNYVKMPEKTSSGMMYALPLIVNYEADIFLKNRDKTKSVKKLYEASKFDERAAYIAVASAVGTIYLNIVRLDKIIDTQKQIVDIRKEIYDLMLQCNDEGLVSTADTVKANKALVAGESELIEYQKQREFLLNQLAVMIGESPANSGELERTAYENINNKYNIPEEISSDIIVQRPDYLKAEKLVEKAGLDVKIARKEFLPTINLIGLAAFNSNNFASMFNTKSMLAAAGGALLLPIFTGGSLITNLKIKKINYDKILQNYYKTNLTAIQEVNDAMVAIKKDNEKLAQTQKQEVLEKKDFAYNTQKYNQGTISRLDLIQFKENLLTIDKLITQQQVDCMIDYIGLYKATGSKI